MNPNNVVVLQGRLTRDLELRYTQWQNTAITRFSVAVDRMNKEKEADFINCVAFGAIAERAVKYLGKGCRVQVAGSIRTGSYENREGQKVYTTEVYVDNISIIDFKDSGRNVAKEMKQAAQDFVPVTDDEDLPF